MASERGIVKFKFGGVSRSVKVTLGLAVDIEEATDRGCMQIAQEYYGGKPRIVVSLEIIRLALAAAGAATYSSEEMRALFVHDGITTTHETATKIIAALFTVPKKADVGNVAAPSPSETTGASL